MVTTKTVYVSSRKSDLALYQTREVISMLQKHYPDVTFEIGLQDTIGDQVLDKHLTQVGGTGLFTKSLEKELLAGRSSFAVHSLKDMPTVLPESLVLGAVCERESPEDAVIIHPKHKANGITTLEDLPKDSIIGTSSLRREALLLKLYPHVQVKTIRGNIQTRLAKLDNEDDYDAIVVAAAGFRRGGLGDRIDQLLDPVVFGYGVGQGSIGVECRGDDTETLEMLAKIEHEESAQCCKAERSLLRTLEGGCQISMGVNTTLDGDELTLSAMLLSRDGQESFEETISGNRFEAESLGEALADRLLKNHEARKHLGSTEKKRALTYGDVEAPGDAAAAAAAAEKIESPKRKSDETTVVSPKRQRTSDA
ncbi:porphobilinogen deaminase [Saprolegnia parasitica CBS 223.65]|uniref:hydroxymethylbilane synthase n=1 Tax=Saprolegnia parasitica (strain CBS 223.65) TaxID=695850 RepID=A0A067CU48_SAPPC|nr:porphobilinogen deaminase [Saprolegnia parasitica CBS 223.65]KDO30312.1 porphobilinogen deaminase [Saprolegnia parasitica CBS 223.65]|eukprot:XP_012198922.1 porphobilinogen deaminase [Saprolegnia parasitica CBS 223.65]